MGQLQYGLVAYVSDPVGQWVEQIRKELVPSQAGSAAHISILPPRPLIGTETEAIETLGELCRDVSAFEVAMGDVESFAPRTPTVFVRVAHAAYRMRELHDRLNTGSLEFEEPWPYMPHMTVAKMADWEQAARALEIAQERWARYTGPRRVHVKELIFVRGSQEAGWVDIAPVRLGRNLSPVLAG
ncbi:MAG TPA: 2'-5' RNA ligase family protein [Terriglobales bacterium]|nr:2'-5' RNA ligase family protein [Terriglobales bacterium]